MRKTIFLILLLLVGCSTIERRTYFSPSADPRLLRGPEKQACGWTNFGGLPDTIVFTVDDKDVSLKAYQNFHPYFWGPWFASIVPVFPLTWLIEPFVSDELTIRLDGAKETISDLKKENVSISFSSGNDTKNLQPQSINFNGYSTSIVFSVDYDSIEAFKLHINDLGQEKRTVEFPFIKTNRWSWTQWTPNC